jgi:hypothetical protein
VEWSDDFDLLRCAGKALLSRRVIHFTLRSTIACAGSTSPLLPLGLSLPVPSTANVLRSVEGKGWLSTARLIDLTTIVRV